MVSTKIDINDLSSPVLNDFQKAALEYGETLDIDFSRDGVLADARERTGLDDFGERDFLERLDLLLDEWGNDSGLTGIGRLSLRNKLVLFASNRLLVCDLLNRHPEIHETHIDRPIIVAGLPRSGTTHLLNLLAADQRFRSLPLWESYEPIALPNETPEPDGASPRYKRTADAWSMMQQVTPHLAAMHPMNPDHIHEELELMGPNFASYNFEWLSMSPRWRDHYYANDQTPHYEYMKTMLKILQWQDLRDGRQEANHVKRWVLKCPQHLEQLPVLKNVFPDATAVVTHRDPVAVIQSSVTMLAYGQRINRTRVETTRLIDYWSDRVEHLLRSCVRDRATWNSNTSIDVPFHTFMADDFGMVENIYEVADIDMTATAQVQLKDFVDEHPRGKHGRMSYHLKRDFGVEPAKLRERFRFYFDRFDIRPEL